ncbi:MAG: hypothetical protein ABI591_13155 [Kofleriaceae bacterium]
MALAGSLYVSYAHAETQAEIAAKENEEGKDLMFAGNYKGASDKFRSAADRAPEAKYYFNLCTSLYQQGVFGAALTACNAGDNLSPDPKLKEKIAKTSDKIKSDAAGQHIDLAPTGTGGGGGPGDTPANGGTNTMGSDQPPNTGGTTGPTPLQPQYAVGRPTQNLIAASKPEHTYVWSLGVDLYGGGGRIGQSGAFGQSSGGVRIKGDYILNPALKLGLQGYLQFTHFGEGTDVAMTGNSLDIFDVGLAAYKHFCGTKALCLTPLLGVQLAFMSPANSTDSTGSQVFNYAAVGARAELALSYAFGMHYEHVVSLQAGVNVYSKVFSEPMDGTSAAAFGLDAGGAAGYGGLGYTYRFDTPFGSAPFVQLE